MAETANLRWLPDPQTLDTGRGAVEVVVGGGPFPDGPSRALYIGAGGTIEFMPVANKASVTLINIPPGYWIECAVTEIVSGTVSNVVAFY